MRVTLFRAFRSGARRLARRVLPWGTVLVSLSAGVPVAAQEPAEAGAAEPQDRIEVIGVTPTQGVGLPASQLPFNTQSATSEDLERGHGLDLGDYLNRHFSGVSINEAQNNRYQPDIQFRGFTASPLLGLPQGLAVYQDGVRVNEVFGDSLNWDLIPEEAIAVLDLVGGANPVFGLNALGGALSIVTKSGFDHPGHGVEMQGGSFSRLTTQLESGLNRGRWAYYAHLNYLDEDSWRDLTSSELKNYFGKLSFRSEAGTELDLSLSYADTELIGNGPAPVELLARAREQIFTAPDTTGNKLRLANLQFTRQVRDFLQFSGNTYYRETRTQSFNGDVSEYEECRGSEQLCEADGVTEVEDQGGGAIAAQLGGTDLNAINNISERDQRSYGGSLQGAFFYERNSFRNQLIVGGAYQHGEADFRSRVEVAALETNRATNRTGIYVPGEGVGLDAMTRTWSLYFTDTLTPLPWLHLTFSGRFNKTRIGLTDTGGAPGSYTESRPDLNGTHHYRRFNPALGFSVELNPSFSFYGGYSESSRAPTPVELACADENAPCNLPNAFLSDPPLEQVVARSFEAGVRGRYGNRLRWRASLFHVLNKDDILFQTTGGVTANQGFFRNVGDTRRLGGEAGLEYSWRFLDLFLNYGFVEATFEDPFTSLSPQHPSADDQDRIQIESGDRIPGLPRHTAKAGLELHPHEQLTLGLNFIFNSGQYLRGDESNQLEPLGSYSVLNFYGEVRAPEGLDLDLSFHIRVDNVLDREYETFGLLGDPGEVFEGFSNPRFLSPGTPRAVFAGLTLAF